MTLNAPNPVIEIGVLASTAATDAVYALFTAAVAARRRGVSASWSSIWYLLSAFAVISYTGNPITLHSQPRDHGSGGWSRDVAWKGRF